ncbi:MAG: hypothetical protein VXV98_02700, partial [Candidatus Thermoplasmatota archaeon]|nr:hypothetical protein [Candidatus Thermoplasmatota archaeon]
MLGIDVLHDRTEHGVLDAVNGTKQVLDDVEPFVTRGQKRDGPQVRAFDAVDAIAAGSGTPGEHLLGLRTKNGWIGNFLPDVPR